MTLQYKGEPLGSPLYYILIASAKHQREPKPAL